MARPAEDDDMVVVTGSAIETGVPDRVSFTFGIIAVKNSADEAAKVTEDKAKKAMAELNRLRIANKNVHTVSVEISFKYEKEYDRSSKVVGYQAERTYEVRLKEKQLDLAADAMQVILRSGVNHISSLNWSMSDKASENLKLKAMKRAQAAARAKAEMLANELGYRLGRLLGIQEGIEMTHRPRRRNARASAAVYATQPAESASIMSTSSMPVGSTTESAAVTLTFALGAPLESPAPNAAAPTVPSTSASGANIAPAPPVGPLYQWKQ